MGTLSALLQLSSISYWIATTALVRRVPFAISTTHSGG